MIDCGMIYGIAEGGSRAGCAIGSVRGLGGLRTGLQIGIVRVV